MAIHPQINSNKKKISVQPLSFPFFGPSKSLVAMNSISKWDLDFEKDVSLSGLEFSAFSPLAIAKFHVKIRHLSHTDSDGRDVSCKQKFLVLTTHRPSDILRKEQNAEQASC
jgi:hypothetical protein